MGEISGCAGAKVRKLVRSGPCDLASVCPKFTLPKVSITSGHGAQSLLPLTSHRKGGGGITFSTYHRPIIALLVAMGAFGHRPIAGSCPLLGLASASFEPSAAPLLTLHMESHLHLPCDGSETCRCHTNIGPQDPQSRKLMISGNRTADRFDQHRSPSPSGRRGSLPAL